MFDGKTFFPETGMPIRKMDCISNVFALAEPVPLTVPILKAKSFGREAGRGGREAGGERREVDGCSDISHALRSSWSRQATVHRRLPPLASYFGLPAPRIGNL